MLGSLGSQDVSLFLPANNVQEWDSEPNAPLIEHSSEGRCRSRMDDSFFMREVEVGVSDGHCGQWVNEA